MKCKFEHDGDCCNCGSPQYMCKCKPNICGSVVPITNADRIRSMSDEELVVFLDEFSSMCIECTEDAKNKSCPIYKDGYYCRPQDIMKWLQQPAEEET